MRTSPSRYVSASNSTRVMREDEAAAPRGRRPCLFLALHHIWGKQAPPRHCEAVVFPHCPREEIRGGLSRPDSRGRLVVLTTVGSLLVLASASRTNVVSGNDLMRWWAAGSCSS